MKKSWINNKVVVITGASSGLGLNIAKMLIEKYSVFVISVCRNEEKMLKAIKDNNIDTKRFRYFVFDVCDRQKWLDFSETLKKENIQVDVLINNAGIMHRFAKFGDLTEEEISEVINTNLVSHINGTKTLLNNILQSSTPMVVNISSSAGVCAIVGESMYCATKYGMRGFTDTLRVDYLGKLKVVGIYPGFIRTNILQKQKEGSSSKLVLKMMMPLNKGTKKIVKGIIRKKKSVYVGFDGKILKTLGKFLPHLGPKIIRKVLKVSKQDIFAELFE